MTRRYWLSFADSKRPEGQRFLGVCIVEVDEEEAEDQKRRIDVQFPEHKENAEWIAAASRKAWEMGCNPGGSVQAADITEATPPSGVEMPLYRLLSKDELDRLGLL